MKNNLPIDPYGNQIADLDKQISAKEKTWIKTGVVKDRISALKQRRQELMDKATDFRVQMAIKQYDDEWNAPANQLDLRRQAGLNSNIEGTPTEASGLQDLGERPSTGQLGPEDIARRRQITNDTFNSVLDCAQFAFDSYNAYRQLEIQQSMADSEIALNEIRGANIESNTQLNRQGATMQYAKEVANLVNSGFVTADNVADFDFSSLLSTPAGDNSHYRALAKQYLSGSASASILGQQAVDVVSADTALKKAKGENSAVTAEDFYAITQNEIDFLLSEAPVRRKELEERVKQAEAHVAELENTDYASLARARYVAQVEEAEYDANYFATHDPEEIAKAEILTARNQAQQARFQLATYNSQVERAESLNKKQKESQSFGKKIFYNGLIKLQQLENLIFGSPDQKGVSVGGFLSKNVK